jgi:hypothetical protein
MNRWSILTLVLIFVVLPVVARPQQPAPATPAATQPAPAAATPAKPDANSSSAKPAPAAETNPDEDWTDLSLSGSRFAVHPPELIEGDETDHFTRELIHMKWRPGDNIDLYVILPKGVKNPPAILYLYSHPSKSQMFGDDTLADTLTRNGYAAIGFDSALNGDRYRWRPLKQWYISELQETMGSSVHDVQMVLNYLSSRGDIDTTRIGMFGDGSGASIAIMAAALDHRIKALNLLNPWGDWPDWLANSSIIPEEERPNYITPEFLKKVAPVDPVKWLPQLTDRKIQIEVVAENTVTPKQARDKMLAAAPPNAVIVGYDTLKDFNAQAVANGKIYEVAKDLLKTSESRPLSANGDSKADHTPPPKQTDR